MTKPGYIREATEIMTAVVPRDGESMPQIEVFGIAT